MVEEMKYISITGPIDNINHVIEHYITRYDIHLEYAAKQLKYTEGLQPFTGVNPYVEALHKAERFTKIIGSVPAVHYAMSGERAVKLVETANQIYERRDVSLKELEYKRDIISKYISNLQNFVAINVDLQQLDTFTHISCSFGKLPVGNYKQFEKFMYDDSEILFFQSHSDNEFIWGVYFTPRSTRDKVNSIFSSLHFEKIPIGSTCLDERRPGTPAALVQYWQDRLVDLNTRIKTLTDTILNEIIGNKEELAAACEKIKELYNTFDIKKYAAVTQIERLSVNNAMSEGSHSDDPAQVITYWQGQMSDLSNQIKNIAGPGSEQLGINHYAAISQKNYYVFVGWMSQKDAISLENELIEDEMTFFSRSGEINEHSAAEAPPTRLKNPPVIRLFEFFTKMYGIPVYGEIDPTPVMAVIYTLLFGLMFGDVGQGLTVAALGFYVYKRFKTDLGGIMTVAGLSSTVFGFLYGSVFGMEEVIPALWRRPAEDINGTLFFGIGIGVCIIFTSMILNIINAVRQKHWGNLFFSPSGIAGMMFYGILLLVVLNVAFNGHAVTGLDIALVCLPLVFVAFREPLTKYMEGDRKIIEGGIGMFLFSTALELVEVLLTYATNTISFVRVGAFAISHASIMGVVMLLAKSAAGTHNPVVIILGNILVMGIEGLLVGIQVLRLDFYEVFSRFYNGGGRMFETYRAKYKV